jgi:hypothetical protein
LCELEGVGNAVQSLLLPTPTTSPPSPPSAIVRADALSIRNNAASLAFQLSHGII